MTRSKSLVASMLLLCAGLAYADPCDDRRVTCAAAFSEASMKCNGDAACVAKAHHTYMSCLAVDECGY